MVLEWNDKGCNFCREMWEIGRHRLIQITININRHAILYRCSECGSYWEEHERFANTISEKDLEKYYPKIFKLV